MPLQRNSTEIGSPATPAAGTRARTRDGRFEVGEFRFEAPKLVTLTGDRVAMFGQRAADYRVDRAMLQAEPGKPSRIAWREAHAAKGRDELEQPQISV